MVKKLLFIIIPLALTISHLIRKFQLWQGSQQEIKNLQTQISQLRNKKTELEKKKKYYQSDEFIKKEARENLGLIKSNEKILVLPSITEVKGDQTEDKDLSSLPSYQQWYKLFFD